MSTKNFNFICIHIKSDVYGPDSWPNKRWINVDHILHIEESVNPNDPLDRKFGTRIIYQWNPEPRIEDVYETIDEVIQLIKRLT